MRRAIALLFLASLPLATGCGGGGGGDSQLADAKVSAGCPTPMFVALPVKMNIRVTNTGSEAWPATFVRLSNLDSFVIDRIADSSGRPGDDVGHDVHRFGSLAAGATETYTYALTPKDAGNPDLELQVWGDKRDAIPIPTSSGIRAYGCSPAIHP